MIAPTSTRKHPRVAIFPVEGLPRIGPGEDLAELVVHAIERSGDAPLLKDDVLVFAQKIVSKAENRYLALDSVTPSDDAIALAKRCQKDSRYVEVVLRESRRVLRVAPGILIVEDRRGLVLANAGIDRSNVDQGADGERVLLLPEDPDRSAASIRERLTALTGVSTGIIINDSLGRAWRLGTTGVAIGVSGVRALWDRRGHLDLQSRPLEATEVGLADELAGAASMVMGQADESRPVILIRGLLHAVGDGIARDLQRPVEKDLFR